MNIFIRIFHLITVCLLTLSVGGCVSESITSTRYIKDVTAQEAFTLIQENQDNVNFIILDVRTPDEFADGHIEDAINIDFNAGDFKNNISNLNRDKEYLVYCRSGNRSGGALEVMEELGFMKIYHLNEGIIGWIDNGHPIVKQ